MRNIIFCFLILGLFACVEQDTSDLNKLVDNEKKKTYPVNDKIPQLENVEIIKFTQGAGRDPFSIPRAEVIDPIKNISTSCPQPNFGRKKEVLEMSSLNNLQMKGTLQSEDQLIALIQTPDGKIHQVKRGDYLGLNYGKVLTIVKNKVKLSESSVDKDGCWHERITQITLNLK